MQALQLTSHQKQGFDNVHIQQIATPSIRAHQVLVRMKAAAFNPADLHTISGEMKMMSPNKVPLTLGIDGSGIIEAVGSAVNHLNVGDHVMFYTGLVWSGTMAEYLAIDASSCALKPDAWSFEQSAAAALGLLCANLALQRANLQQGQHVLIHGGGGAVGAAAIVLAKHLGATVDTTASAADEAYVRSLGAQTVYDYKRYPLSKLPHAYYDAVLDGMGESVFLQSLPLIKPNGVIASLKVMTGLDDMERMGMKIPFFIKWLMPLMFRKYTQAAAKAHVRLQSVATYQDGATLQHLAQLAVELGYEPRIAKSFPMSEARAALDYFINGHPRGKVLVHI